MSCWEWQKRAYGWCLFGQEGYYSAFAMFAIKKTFLQDFRVVIYRIRVFIVLFIVILSATYSLVTYSNLEL